jgi:CP family cyanate transporter-like MFS transporter
VSNRAFLIALMLIAANLRPSITSVGPLLDTIQHDLMLSDMAAGWLGSLPVLVFAALAPLSRLARRHGAERMLLIGLLALIAGILLRSEGDVPALFAGTAILATGIAGTNVLLPVVIKQRYPERVPAITTAYATLMGGLAALASGIAVPLAHGLPGGWRASLASWALPAAIALILWLPHSRSRQRGADPAPESERQPEPLPAQRTLWRAPVAWQITGFMGLQSTLFYVAISWFPVILREHGFSAVAAGWLLTLFQVAALPAGLVVAPLMRRFTDQRALAFGTAALSALAVVGILVAPAGAAAWMVLLGCGSGPSLILALSFMGLRAHTQQTAAGLSLMSQSIGYLIATLGPLGFGVLHDWTGGWTVGLLGTVAVAIIQGLCGLGAGRAVKL